MMLMSRQRSPEPAVALLSLTTPPYEKIIMNVPTFAEDLRDNGFDICHPFQTEWYNEWIEQEQVGLSKLCSGTKAYLVGNTKHMWAFFKRWLQNHEPEVPSNPIDTFCTEAISKVVLKQRRDCTMKIHWASETDPTKLISLQRVASVSAFAYLDNNTHLTVHPEFGTWHSYRAVVVVVEDHSSNVTAVEKPKPVPCQLSPEEEEEARKALRHALDISDESNLCAQLHGDFDKNMDLIRGWIALRNVVNVGREKYRFPEDQLMYHYTKDPKYLR